MLLKHLGLLNVILIQSDRSIVQSVFGGLVEKHIFSNKAGFHFDDCKLFSLSNWVCLQSIVDCIVKFRFNYFKVALA